MFNSVIIRATPTTKRTTDALRMKARVHDKTTRYVNFRYFTSSEISYSLIAASTQNEETMGDFKHALSSK
jgi:hypothetical protein